MSAYSFSDQELNEASDLLDYLTEKYKRTDENSQPYIGVSDDPIDNEEAELLEGGGETIVSLINAWTVFEGAEGRFIPKPSEPGLVKEATVLYASVLRDLIAQFRADNYNQRRIIDLTIGEFKELMRSILAQPK